MLRIMLFLTVLALAAVLDVRNRIIPDWVTFLLAGVSLIPPGTVCLDGLLVAIPLLLVGVTIGGIGGGDIKLTGACGLVLGFWETLIGLTVGLLFLLIFHAGRQAVGMIRKRKNYVGKEQAYPLVPFLFFGMLFSIRMGGQI